MDLTEPKVSVGLAVFNGDKYLEEAIKSVLAQTLTDFELIISDNASTDRTQEICKLYASQDSRIRYYRNKENIGPVNNENSTFKLSRGKYFKLMAHDDFIAPTFLEECLQILEKDDSVILCYTAMVKIDEQGIHINTVNQKLAESLEPHERFRELLEIHHDGEATYGLIRRKDLDRVQLQPNYPHSDTGYLCELSLYGLFQRLDQPLFYKRFHSERVSGYSLYQKMVSHKTLVSHLDLSNYPNFVKNAICHSIYFLLELIHFCQIIYRSPTNISTKAFCFFFTLRKLLRRILLENTWEFRQKIFLSKKAILHFKSLFVNFQ